MISFWKNVQDFFIAQWLFVWETLGDSISSIWKRIGEASNTNISNWWNDALEKEIESSLERLGFDPQRVNAIRTVVNTPFPVDILSASFIYVIYLFTVPFRFLFTAGGRAQWELNQEVRPNLLDVQTIVNYLIRNPQDISKGIAYLEYNGLDQEQIEMAIKGLQRNLEPTALLELLRRDLISERAFLDELNRIGYDNEDAQSILKLRWLHPSPQDLVMLAGRDQFEPETIEKFKLQQDLPPVLVEEAKKAGMSEEWIKRYWGAHWTVPSIQQAFIMFQREVINDADLDTYYKLADISPFFGDKLKQIAYLPYPRVDVRRMHQIGVLNDEQLVKAYKDIGYSPERAANLAEFTVRYNKRVDRDLSRGQIESLYEEGFISGKTFRNYMLSLDYDETEAMWLQTLVDFKVEKSRVKPYINRVESQFKRQNIDEVQVSTDLGNQGIKADKAQFYIDRWKNEMITERRMPTKEDVIGWAQTGLIDVSNFVLKMRELKFKDSDIQLYVNELGLDDTGVILNE
tara:strand:+ start:591 stop:2138 length:1548 start_codon:yes stop_codon:yes gene_type:complete